MGKLNLTDKNEIWGLTSVILSAFTKNSNLSDSSLPNLLSFISNLIRMKRQITYIISSSVSENTLLTYAFVFHWTEPNVLT